MIGQTRHPAAEVLADFRAGLVGGMRGRRLAAHLARCPACASVSERLDEVSAALAAVPAPALPDNVALRVVAAIAAEASAREARSLAGAPGTDAAPADVPTAGLPAADVPAAGLSAADVPVPGLAPAGASAAGHVAGDGSAAHEPAARGPATGTPGRGGNRRPLWSRRVRLYPSPLVVPIGALASAVACLFAVIGYVLSGSGGHPSGPPVAGVTGTAPPVPQISGGTFSPGPHRDSPTPPGIGGIQPAFVIITSGTNYRKATLQEQIRQVIAASASASGSAPSSSIFGCVMHFTDNDVPTIVDRAEYDSEPAYVIALPTQAWVVGLACTANDPDLLASVAMSPAA
jgi:hypothetical protein